MLTSWQVTIDSGRNDGGEPAGVVDVDVERGVVAVGSAE